MSSCWVGYSSSMELLLHFCQKSFECIWLGLLLSSVFCSIDLWVYGETMETMTDFIFLGSKITADADCSHEIKRRLLLGRKATTNLDSILKSRDIILPTKVHLVKAMFFPVVMYGCESWTLKKAECWRIDAFELVLEKTLESLLDCKEIKPVNSKEIGPDYSLEDWCWSWSSDNLTTWWEEVTHWKRPWCWENWRQEEKGTTEDEMVGWHHWLNGHEFEQAPRVVMDRAA